MGTRALTIVRPMRLLAGVFCLAAGMVSLTSAATAQTYQGGIRGAVRDANGVVPGADVVLVNEETTLPRTTVTNAVGEYAFVNVLPGLYTLKASLAGFKTFERHGVRISTQDFLTLDVALEVDRREYKRLPGVEHTGATMSQSLVKDVSDGKGDDGNSRNRPHIEGPRLLRQAVAPAAVASRKQSARASSTVYFMTWSYSLPRSRCIREVFIV